MNSLTALDTKLNREIRHYRVAMGISITLLAVSVLALSAALVARTTFGSSLPLLREVSKLTDLQWKAVVIGASLLTAASAISLIKIQRSFCLKLSSHKLRKQLALASTPERKLAVAKEAIEKQLFCGFKKKFELYDFYYQLAVATECMQEYGQEAEWTLFLQDLSQKEYRVEGTKIKINIAFELRRFARVKPELTVSKLEENASEEDIQAIHRIYNLAFSTNENYVREKIGQGCLYVIREKEKIYGAICLQEVPGEQNNKNLYVHSLAREPSAVKLGMTETLKKELETVFLPSNYKSIFCEVLKNNLPAQSIYESLGFKKVGNSPYSPSAFLMHYEGKN